MIEKVNPCHPDKVADRIAGAIVDLAYQKADNPRVAVEVLIGHGVCTTIIESSVDIPEDAKELYRSLGSIDLVAAARSVLHVERRPDDDTISGVHHVKSSLAPKGKDACH